MWNVITLIHKEGIMEAHEEVDIVIGEKKSFFAIQLQSSHVDRNVIQRFYFFASGKIWGVFNFYLNAFKWKI